MRTWRKKLLRAVVIFGTLLPLMSYIVVEPHTFLAQRAFAGVYSIVPAKALLRIYASNLDRFNGGWVPAEVDELLCNRFHNTHSDVEQAAIVAFYIDRASRCRFGQIPSERLGPDFLNILFQLLSSGSDQQRTGALMIIESIRIGRPLYKAQLTPVHFRVKSLFDVENAYKQWWELPLPWAEKQRLNPLKNWEYGWDEP